MRSKNFETDKFYFIALAVRILFLLSDNFQFFFFYHRLHDMSDNEWNKNLKALESFSKNKHRMVER